MLIGVSQREARDVSASSRKKQAVASSGLGPVPEGCIAASGQGMKPVGEGLCVPGRLKTRVKPWWPLYE